ncbi:MAG TPA: alanine dehydrogenase [Burkholderiales bacterium]|nr:alanine dehydrogenase [Burkholderiales bacterium]
MRIGVPKEVKNNEFRVGITPAGAHALIEHGHQVVVESQAGARVGFGDADYIAAGASIVPSHGEVWDADLIVKVKELQRSEYDLLKRGQVLFTYLHLAPDRELLDMMLSSGVIGIAYETVTDAGGGLPLLAPMSRIAGKLAIQFGAWALQMSNGGSGVLLGGVPGVPPGKVVVIGAGAAGQNAVRVAVGMGADVTVFDLSAATLAHVEDVFGGRVKTCYSQPLTIAEQVAEADLVVGATLTPGKLAPKLIIRATLRKMRPGSVLVDVSIDQGGIAETSRPTSHSAPVYVEEGVLHYCVPNMPSAVARTATLALTQATISDVMALADKGFKRALRDDPGLRNGLQICAGYVTHAGLAQDTGRPYVPAEEALNDLIEV